MANRLLVVGWDGADWDILDPLLAAGELPASDPSSTVAVAGCLVPVSPRTRGQPVPTFLTGRDPGGHGVFDILEYRPGAMRRLPVSSRSILAPIWPERVSEAGKTTLLLNVPLTYPTPEIRGVVIAGGVLAS
jgi:predicted AlkP superfamily phosphohydrolase/phosphomutase